VSAVWGDGRLLEGSFLLGCLVPWGRSSEICDSAIPRKNSRQRQSQFVEKNCVPKGVPILELTLGIMEKPASVFWVILESSGKGAQKAFLFLHTRRSVMQGVPLCGA
jgi:hypothetical protein